MESSEVEKLIALVASLDTPESVHKLNRDMEGREVFFRIITERKVDPKSGLEIETANGSPLLVLPSGEKALRVHTSQDDSRLERPFGGAPWQHVVRIALSNAEIAGILLTNLHGDTVAIDRVHLQELAEINQKLIRPPLQPRHLR